MAIYELWLERDPGRKYIAHYNRLPPERGNDSFTTPPMDSPQAAAQIIRTQLRQMMTATDQFRIRSRSNVYDNINDALEDMMRY